MESTSYAPEIDLTKRRGEFLAELRSQIDSPPNSEEVTRQFHEAALYCTVRIEAYRDLTNAYLATEPVPVPSYWLNKFFKAHQIELLRPEMREKWSYPEAFGGSGKWREFIIAHLSSPDHPVYANVCQNLQQRLQINRWKRKQALAFIIGGMQMERTTNEPFVVHDYGSAENLVLKALAIRAMTNTVVHNQENTPDADQTNAFNEIATAAELGRGYGIEVDPPQAEEDHHRIKGFTMDPSQLDRRAPQGREEDTYDMLVMAPPPSVISIRGDFLDLPHEQAKLLEEDKADMAFLSHIFPQNPGREKEIITKVLKNLKPNGIIMLNEYASPHPENATKLIYPSNWYSTHWRCSTLGLLASRPEEGFFPIFNWRTAHCEHVRIIQEGLSRLALDHLMTDR